MPIFRQAFLCALVGFAFLSPVRGVPVSLPHEKAVYAAVFTPDGKTLLTASNDGFIRRWDVPGRREIGIWPAHKGGILALVMTADGKTLASGGRDGHVRFWQADNSKELSKFQVGPGDVEALALSADGKVFAASSSGRTGLFRVVDYARFG